MLCYVVCVCEKNKRKIMQNQNIVRFWFQFNNEENQNVHKMMMISGDEIQFLVIDRIE